MLIFVAVFGMSSDAAFLCLTKINVMTIVEYNAFAKKILKEEIECSDEITNIGEIFLLKIKEGIAKLDENTFPHREADKFNNMFLSFVDSISEDNETTNIGSLPPNDKINFLIDYLLFLGISLAIKNHSNPEYMLHNLGIEDSLYFIRRMNDIEHINNVDDFRNQLCDIHNFFPIISFDNWVNMSLWGVISFFGKSVIDFCKDDSALFILNLLKTAKYFGEKYLIIYKERIASIFYTIKSLFEGDIESLIPQDILDYLFNHSLQIKSFIDIEDSMPQELGDKYEYLGLDFLFVCYYFVYENPQNMIKLGFTLMSEKVSNAIKGAMFSTFKEQTYAPIIQYEYEWWCKETGEKLSLPFPFFEGIIDLKKINIIDYDLNNRKQSIKQTDENKNLHSDLILESNNNTLRLDSPSIESIFENLKPYLRFVVCEDKTKVGASFKNNHLTAVTNIARELDNRYSVYGFACILFLSKYFVWKNFEFNKDFVTYIVDIFGIDSRLIEGSYYNFSKSKDKAKKMLNKEETSHLKILLDDKGTRKLSE